MAHHQHGVHNVEQVSHSSVENSGACRQTSQWGIFGGLEALVDMMMISWSTAMLVAVIHDLYFPVLRRWGWRQGFEVSHR